jgi:hypothetical protein
MGAVYQYIWRAEKRRKLRAGRLNVEIFPGRNLHRPSNLRFGICYVVSISVSTHRLPSQGGRSLYNRLNRLRSLGQVDCPLESRSISRTDEFTRPTQRHGGLSVGPDSIWKEKRQHDLSAPPLSSEVVLFSLILLHLLLLFILAFCS